MTELKPCPFCGTKPHPITADLHTRPCFYYECENKTCHAAEKGWHDTEQEAIDAWNTRPIEDALRSRITELEKHIKNAVDDIEATLKCLPYAPYIDKVKILERIKYILTAEPQEEK
jgi:Lar family restriction alleviation protein